MLKTPAQLCNTAIKNGNKRFLRVGRIRFIFGKTIGILLYVRRLGWVDHNDDNFVNFKGVSSF